MAVDLFACRIKLKGARDNIDRFEKKTSPLDPQLYDLRSYFIFERNAYVFRYSPKEPIPETLANVMGDALGNLRSALDYAAVRITGSKVYFPLAPRKDLPSHKDIAPIEKAVPGFKDLLLTSIRPEGGSDEPLWDLVGKLNNENKHTDFIPTVTALEVTDISVQIGTNTLTNCSINSDAAAQYDILQAPIPIIFTGSPKVTVVATFGPRTPVAGRAIVSALRDAAQVVTNALDKVEKLVNPPY